MFQPGTPTNPGPGGNVAPTGPTAIENGVPFGLPQTLGDPNQPDPNAVQPTAPAQPTPEELRLAALEQTNQQILAQNQQLMQMLMTQRVPTQQQQPAGPQPLPSFSLDGLPDAVAAPKDFVTQLGQRISQREQQLGQYITHNVTQQIARGAAMDGVFNRFQFQHSDLAKRGALLQGAAIQEFQQLQAQGIDPVMVAQQNPDSLVTRIAQRMQAELGIQAQQPGQPNGNVHGAPLTPFSPPTPGQPNASRVAGIAGGSGTPVGVKPEPKPLGFVEQLNKARRESGLI